MGEAPKRLCQNTVNMTLGKMPVSSLLQGRYGGIEEEINCAGIFPPPGMDDVYWSSGYSCLFLLILINFNYFIYFYSFTYF